MRRAVWERTGEHTSMVEASQLDVIRACIPDVADAHAIEWLHYQTSSPSTYDLHSALGSQISWLQARSP